MTSREFQAAVSAIGAGTAEPPSTVPDTQVVAVLGSCPHAQALAAAFLAAGSRVRLFSTSDADVAALRQSGGITVRGDGPIGTFSVDPSSEIHIEIVGGIDAAVTGADLVMVVGTVVFQRAMGILLADAVGPGQIALAVPGRTFGALELAWWLGAGDNRPTVGELQDLPWEVTATGPASIELSPPAPVRVGTLPPLAASGVAQALSRALPEVGSSPTVLHSSLGDATGLVDVPALIVGGPGTRDEPGELLPGAERIDDSPPAGAPLLNLVERLADERRAVAERWGVRDMPSTFDWVGRVARLRSEPGGAGARDAVLEGTAGSLVPLASAGRMAGVPTPVTDAVITGVSAMFAVDLTAAGRRLENLGLAGSDLDAVRRSVGPVRTSNAGDR